MGKSKIILVEDSKFQGIITRDILVKNGYEVTWVMSAEQVIENDLYQDYDLILLDVLLPCMSGYELCEIIKKNNKLIPVIMLTSMEDEKSVVKALNSGADDYIKKPYNIDELLARIRVQIRTRVLQMELIYKNSELIKANEMIKKLAITDMLTGAYNRAYIIECLDKIKKDSSEESLVMACIMIDIDNFKSINDQYGHLTGDVVLKNVADICMDSVGELGAAIRFGGEEFLVVVKDKIETVNAIAEKIRHQCEKSVCSGFKYTVSVGVSVSKMTRDNILDDFQEGIRIADKMLYLSKNNGKNKVTIKEVHDA